MSLYEKSNDRCITRYKNHANFLAITSLRSTRAHSELGKQRTARFFGAAGPKGTWRTWSSSKARWRWWCSQPESSLCTRQNIRRPAARTVYCIRHCLLYENKRSPGLNRSSKRDRLFAARSGRRLRARWLARTKINQTQNGRKATYYLIMCPA